MSIQSIRLPFGFCDIDDAARFLVEHAPARADYFGFTIRARFATTRPADVVEQYRRTVHMGALSFFARLSASQRARMRCHGCGATGCKMWREYQTFADLTKILCGPCALADQGKAGTIDADGKRESDFGKCDQIGWLVPAVPTHECGTFWGYTSVPADGVEWWRALPSYPKAGL